MVGKNIGQMQFLLLYFCYKMLTKTDKFYVRNAFSLNILFALYLYRKIVPFRQCCNKKIKSNNTAWPCFWPTLYMQFIVSQTIRPACVKCWMELALLMSI